MNLCEAGVESNPDMLEFYFYLAIATTRRNGRMMPLPSVKGFVARQGRQQEGGRIRFYAIIGDAYHTKNLHAEAYAGL